MEDFKQIDKCDVWPHLQAGKKVYVVIFASGHFNTGLKKLNNSWDVDQINRLLTDKEKNVMFYEEVKND